MDAQERTRIFIFRPTLADGGADRVTVTLLNKLDRKRFDTSLVLMRREGVWLNDLEDEITVYSLEGRRLRYSWLALARLLRQHRPDVLLSTSSGGNVLAALAHWVAGSSGRLILSERNTFTVARRARLPRWLPVAPLKRALYHRADIVVAVSEGVARDLVASLHLSESHVTVIYNPVVDGTIERQAQEPLTHPWFDQHIPVILAVGRLNEQKDHATLLKAVARLRAATPLRVSILGEGPLRGRLRALAHELGLGMDVDLRGFVKNPFPYMRRCTVFVLSSRFEGLPGALIQAMACGAPVISTDCPSGPREIITSPEEGFLVPVGDADALARAIGILLGDSLLRRRMGEAGRRRAREFDAATAVAGYEEVLAGSRRLIDPEDVRLGNLAGGQTEKTSRRRRVGTPS